MTASANSTRLAAVAAAYLRPRQLASRCVVVAGSPGGLLPSPVGERLVQAAESLGVAAQLVPEGDSLMSPATSIVAPSLYVLSFGQPDAHSVRRLPAPTPGAGPDLLLWCLRSEGRPSLRELYTLALWSWSLDAKHTRCLLPPGAAAQVHALRRELATHQLGRVELLTWPEREPELQQLALSVLQSALSGGRSGAGFGARTLLEESAGAARRRGGREG